MSAVPDPAFEGVLGRATSRSASHAEAEAIFSDLHLDRVVAAATEGREAYDLAAWFSEPLADPAAITYRQRVSEDLERPPVRAVVQTFARAMSGVHATWARGDRASYLYQRLGRYRDALEQYCGAVESLAQELPRAPLASDGLRALAAYVTGYAASAGFRALATEVRDLGRQLAGISYTILVHGSRITVQPYAGEDDYSRAVEQTFERFRQAGSKRFDFPVHGPAEMNPVEEAIFEHVVALNPEPFQRLRALGDRSEAAFDAPVLQFEREVEFYLAYHDLLRPLREAGLPFVYPELSPDGHAVAVQGAFDLALAHDLVGARAPVVANDVELSGVERVLVVTGPNQGGKTTYARLVGQLHYLARLGLPVPGRVARLPLCDRVFTMFERLEHPENLRGKLQEELVQVRDILRAATDRSVLVLNESFSSTSLQDATVLGRRVLEEIIARGAVAVYVTFVDELAALGPAVVSVVGGVSPTDPTQRTFRVTRAPANGRAYAVAIAEKFGLTYAQLRGRWRA